MWELKEATLSRLGLPTVDAERTIQVTAAVAGPHEIDEATRDVLADALADRLRRDATEQLGDKVPTGIAESEIESSGDADCEDVHGQPVHAFQDDQRCYKIILQIVSNA